VTSEHAPPPGGRSGFLERAGPPTTVLLVDDDADVREIVRELLTSDGYEVSSAIDGKEALERLATMVDAGLPLPDVLVLDFVMPGLSGLGILKALARMSRLPPTVILTGFPDPSVDTFARKLGALRVLRKPVDADALCAAVGEAAAANRGRMKGAGRP
jgi:CheY-like chemotaxis protein